MKSFLSTLFTAARHLLGFTLWFYIVSKLFVGDLDNAVFFRYMPRQTWILEFKPLLIPLFFVVFFIAWKIPRLMLLLISVLLYPLILIAWDFPRLALAKYAIVLALAPLFYDFAITFRTTLIWYSIALACSFSICKTSNKITLAIYFIYLFVFLVYRLSVSLRRAYGNTVFSEITKIARSVQTKIESGTPDDVLSKGTLRTKDGVTVEVDRGLNLLMLNRVTDLISIQLREAAGKWRIDSYLFFSMRLLGHRPRYQEGPPEGAVYVRKPPLGAGSLESPTRAHSVR